MSKSRQRYPRRPQCPLCKERFNGLRDMAMHLAVRHLKLVINARDLGDGTWVYDVDCACGETIRAYLHSAATSAVVKHFATVRHSRDELMMMLLAGVADES